MNASQRPASLAHLSPSALAAAEQIARRNLERARVLGNTVAQANACRWYMQVRTYANTVRTLTARAQ